MDNFSTNGPSLVPFKLIYAQNITPKLETIDLFIKTTEAPYSISQVASILHTSEEDIVNIMTTHEIETITLLELFTIISHCSSYICGLIRRQWKYVNCSSYTPSIIAEIYEINLHKVEAAFKELEVNTIAADELMDVFSRIHTPVYNFSFF